MKRLVAVVFVLLVLAVGMLAWRVSTLADEVDRMSRAPATLAPADPSPAAATARDLDPRPPPTLAPADTALASRVAALESRLNAILSRLSDAGRTEDDARELVAQLVGDRMRANEIAAVATSRNAIS